MASFTHRPLPSQGKHSQYTLNRRPVWKLEKNLLYWDSPQPSRFTDYVIPTVLERDVL